VILESCSWFEFMKKYLKVLPAVYHFHVLQLVSSESIDTENFNQRYYLMSQEFVSDLS